MIRRASFPIALIFALLAFGSYAIHGGEKDNANPVTAQLFIAGIVDASGTIGYVENGKDTIAAIELATGKEIWKSGGLMQPLIGFEGQLLVLVRQDRELLIHWIEAATGKFIRASSPIALPEWSNRPIRFGGRAAMLDGDLLLECFITEDSHGGAAPHTTMIRARIALDSGKVTPIAAGESGQSFSRLAPKDLKKVGELTFDIIATTESNAPQFFTTKRTLRALNVEGKVVWTRKLPTWEIGPPKP
jgi:outer membrane protein assembly factor BamB